MAARSSSKVAKALQVTAPLVQVQMGDRSVQFFNGDVLPDGVSEDSVEHLKSLGYVDEVKAPDAGDPVDDDSDN
jgi:hypothetical protein